MSTRRGRGRPRREYRIRVRAERREHPDYEKLARALLEHAAIQEQARRAKTGESIELDTDTATETPKEDA